MSTSSKSDSDDSNFEIEELLVIEAKCRELRREKDLLKETQSQSFDLIKKLEMHVRKLNEARTDDKTQIQELERKLSNCHQEIDYLQDQLNARNSEMECLEEEILSLREVQKKSNSQCEFLMQELETRETELQKSSFHIANLEELISSASLDYQCEIESMRLEMMTLEPPSEFLQLQIYNAQKKIEKLENENKQAREELKREKLKAKEEAEELAQEMAELRYQMTELLEEEKKRRVYIEQASLQRISELEAQLRIEQRKSAGTVQYICET